MEHFILSGVLSGVLSDNDTGEAVGMPAERQKQHLGRVQEADAELTPAKADICRLVEALQKGTLENRPEILNAQAKNRRKRTEPEEQLAAARASATAAREIANRQWRNGDIPASKGGLSGRLFHGQPTVRPFDGRNPKNMRLAQRANCLQVSRSRGRRAMDLSGVQDSRPLATPRKSGERR